MVSSRAPKIEKVSLIIVFKLCRLVAYSTRSQWWGCHLSIWAGWLSVGVASLSLWSSPFSTGQWCWVWSTLGILFPQYPPYVVSLPLTATWGGARWETSNSTRENREKRILILYVCTSVRPHGTTLIPWEGFSWNLIFEYFFKTCRENSSFIKIWLYMTPILIFNNISLSYS